MTKGTSFVLRLTSADDRPTTRESIFENKLCYKNDVFRRPTDNTRIDIRKNNKFFRDSQPTDNARVGIGKTSESSYVTADRQRAKTSIFRPTPPSLGIRPEELGLT